MHDDVGAVERLAQRVGVADVALPVLHLRPAALGRVEGTAGDADDPGDPVVVLEQRASGPSRTCRSGPVTATVSSRSAAVRLGESARALAERAGARVAWPGSPAAPRRPSWRACGLAALRGALSGRSADRLLARASSSSMPRRMPPERTSMSG